MSSNLQPTTPRCTVYDWCSYTHEQPGGTHLANINLIEVLDDPNLVVEVNLYAPDDTTPPVIRVLFPGDGVTAYIDVSNDVAGGISTVIGLFEGPGLNDRRGLREFAKLLAEGAGRVSGVTEL
ncbi:hypothetical protein ACIBEJ_48530 [Nonomuraea sp. NPDC050790]|uniref:hypothetical protein n=1 Tax=Nonomuraea sp. NPDC050790 TaxID=3364371 RepID=UPI00379CAA46